MEICKQCPEDPENPKEFYRFFNKVFDVDLARKIIERDKPNVGFVTREQLEKMGMQVEFSESSFSLMYHADEAHLSHIPEEKLSEPVIFATIWTDSKPDAVKFTLMIDGTHRSVIKFRAGADKVDAYLLDEKQSKECCIEGWTQPRKKKK